MKSPHQSLKWIQELSSDNFLAVYDVMLDIRDELQIGNAVVIPIYRQVIRFPRLYPAESVGLLERYCELRWKAANLLKNKKIIDGCAVIKGLNRWRSKLQIQVKKTAFDPYFLAVERIYKSRYNVDLKTAGSLSQVVSAYPCELIKGMLLRFHAVVTQICNRHESRHTLDVSDEYDVQDLLHSLLVLHFDDIRSEEWTPSYAGKSARVDFFLKPEKIVVEVKKTRKGLGTKEVGEQLIIDKARYSKMSGCETLICFIYDPENRITNPSVLETDLAEKKKGFSAEVIVTPKQY